MAFVNPLTPNVADFTTWLASQGVGAGALPADPDYLEWALNSSIALTITASPCIQMQYVLAVYNYGLHWLICNALDPQGSVYFTNARKGYNILTFVAGPVLSSFDNGTGQTLAGSAGVKDFSITAMSAIKTPWGAFWVGYEQAYGPTIVGLS